MGLSAGSTLGVYEIVSLLGSGGMGEVYRARDAKLGREVAIKVLPEAFASDPERVARFEREAKVLASLNHPHIAALYGKEVSDGRHFLIMELVEGETLAERIRRGAIPVEEALRTATQIAEALEAAHEKGVVHRDLKPANVKITPDEQVKVLDFGLAKALDPVGRGFSPAGPAGPEGPAYVPVSQFPTITTPALMTGAGVILGTAAYMSPEQAKGLPADHRSDVFSLGCVLYEMLTGRQPFHGDTTPEILASVLAREPDFAALPESVNPRLSELLRRCLDKHPKRRWQAVGDLRMDLESIAAAPRSVVSPVAAIAPRQPLWRRAMSVAAIAMVASALTAVATLYLRHSPAPAATTRLSLTFPEGQRVAADRSGSLAVSPDGTRVAYVLASGLHVRSMSDLNATRVVDNAEGPVFSPDGQSIAFFAGGSLRRIAAAGGTVSTICPVAVLYGMSWGADGILFGQGSQGVFRVSPNGGVPERVVALAEGEWAHGPQMLPRGDSVLFTLSTGTTPDRWDAAQIVVQSIASGERKVLVRGGTDARYSASGHLVYAVGGVLFAVPFDVRRLEVTGPAVPVVDGVRRSGMTGAAHFAVSEAGSLVYVPGPTGALGSRVDIVIADRAGSVERLALPTGGYEVPRVSPDGTRIAFGSSGVDQNIWIYDLAGTTAMRRLTFGGRNRFPVWSADGQRVAFQSDREGDVAIFWQAADGSGTAERLTTPAPETSHVPDAWSPKNDRLLFSVVAGPRLALWSLSLQDRRIEPFGEIEAGNPIGAAFSPDGQWVAYRVEDGIYVEPVPLTGAKYQISKEGHHMVWSRDGKEIFYLPGGVGRLSSVPVSLRPGFSFGSAAATPRGFTEGGAPNVQRSFDVTPDGKFVGLVPPQAGETQPDEIAVVLNWQEELKQRVPTR